MINHTTAGDEQQKRVATTEQTENTTTNHQWERKGWWPLAMRAKGRQLAIGNERGRSLSYIRSAKQDEIYGASNIVLPCPSS
jgi:hypothetical protein